MPVTTYRHMCSLLTRATLMVAVATILSMGALCSTAEASPTAIGRGPNALEVIDMGTNAYAQSVLPNMGMNYWCLLANAEEPGGRYGMRYHCPSIGTKAVSIGPDSELALSMAKAGSGTVLAGYGFSNAASWPLLVKLTQAGQLDAAFGGGDGIAKDDLHPTLTHALLTGVGVQQVGGNSGKVVVCGVAWDVSGGHSEIIVARYTAAGGLDPTFGTNGITIVTRSATARDVANSLTVLPDDRVVVVGSTAVTPSSASDFLAVGLTNNGALNPAFGVAGMTTVNAGARAGAWSVTTYSPYRFPVSQAVIVSGSYRDARNLVYPVVHRLRANGTLDDFGGARRMKISTFYDSNPRVLQYVPVVEQDDGRVYVGAEVDWAIDTDLTAARLTSTGAYDPKFARGGMNQIDTMPGAAHDQESVSDIAELTNGLSLVGTSWRRGRWTPFVVALRNDYSPSRPRRSSFAPLTSKNTIRNCGGAKQPACVTARRKALRLGMGVMRVKKTEPVVLHVYKVTKNGWTSYREHKLMLRGSGKWKAVIYQLRGLPRGKYRLAMTRNPTEMDASIFNGFMRVRVI